MKEHKCKETNKRASLVTEHLRKKSECVREKKEEMSWQTYADEHLMCDIHCVGQHLTAALLLVTTAASCLGPELCLPSGTFTLPLFVSDFNY